MSFSVMSLFKFLRGWLLVIAVSGLSSLVAAQPMVVGMMTSVQEGVDVLKIDFSAEAPKNVSAYAITSPARLVIDLPLTKSGLERNKLEVSQGTIRGVNVVEVADRTRMVVTLKQSATHRLSASGNTLLVFFSPIQEQAAHTNSQVVFTDNTNVDTQPLGAVDFRRLPDGGGRIEVALPSNKAGVDVKLVGPELVVEFLKSSLAAGQKRRLDVSDFGTPVQTLTTSASGDRVRLSVEAKGTWEHSVFQSDTRLTIDIKAPVFDANKASQGVGYTGEKLSLNFQNIEIRALLQVIADFTNFNIITSESVTGNVTLRLKDVPWDQALDIILQTKSLGMRKSGGVLWIAPKEELAAKEKQELDAQLAIQNVEPLKTQSFQLNYTKAADIMAQLSPQGGAGGSGKASGVLSARGSVMAEPRTNQLFVTDIASRLVLVQEMIAKLDVAVRQVLIEARIVEANDSFGKSLGVKWGTADLGGINGGQAGDPIGSTGKRIGFGASYDAVSISTGQSTGSLTTTNTQLVSMPASGQGGFSPASIAVSLFSGVAGRYLNLELSALEADGKGKIVSSPRIVTADQTKALIEQGTELPYQAATSSGATSVQFRKANLKLEVTPQITPEGNVILDLDVNKDSVGQSTAAGFAIDTKHIKTQVLVENGGTVVIGGIFEIIETDSEARVPVLGDLPLVGNAFKSKSRKTSKQEMLVFITPKVISSGQVVR